MEPRDFEDEQLVRTPSVEEACIYLEGWARGARYPAPLILVGEAGVGKHFLLQWGLRLRERFVQEGKGRGSAPFPEVHTSSEPPDATRYFLVQVGLPEYERKQGVLLEWARVRGFSFTPRALELLLRYPTHNLERLRGLASRIVIESGGKTRIEETDVLRTLERAGILKEIP